MNEIKLIELAFQYFGILDQADRKLFLAVANGELADFSAKDETQNDPCKAEEWAADRRIKSDRITWLCKNPQASAEIRQKGIGIKGALIEGKLDLQFANLAFPLFFEKCAVTDEINLRSARLPMLFLSGSHIKQFGGNGLRVDGSIILREGFVARAEVQMTGAIIAGNFECDAGHFLNAGGIALNLEQAKIGGTVLFRRGFEANGEVRLLMATVGGNLVSENAAFSNPGKIALNADAVRVEGRLLLRRGFKAEGEVILYGANIGGNFDCREGLFRSEGAPRAITADGLKVGGFAHLAKGFRAEGEVTLYEAAIEASLDFGGGQLVNPAGFALKAEGLRVGGSLRFVREFRAEGEVRLTGSSIGRNCLLETAQFINPGKVAIWFDGTQIEGSIFLGKGFKAEGEVRLVSATIGGNVIGKNAEFINHGQKAFNLTGIKVNGFLTLRPGLRVEGEIGLYEASIGGLLDLEEARLENPTGKSLDVGCAKVGGSVLLRKGFASKGEVSFFFATIGKSLECDGSHFLNSGRISLGLEGVKTGGSILLRNGFKAEGAVRLFAAVIAGSLECDGGEFNNNGGVALNAEGSKIERQVYLRNGCKALGEVRFRAARIGGTLNCDRATFVNAGSVALNAFFLRAQDGVALMNMELDGGVILANAKIEGPLSWINISKPTSNKPPNDVELDLRFARAETFSVDYGPLPPTGKMHLHGFVYNEIDEPSTVTTDTRIRWLSRQPVNPFQPQPYEQLAAVLRKRGHEEDSIRLLRAREKIRASKVRPLSAEWWWYRGFGRIIGHGYRPWTAFWVGLVIIVFGTFVFERGFRAGLITPTKDNAFINPTTTTLKDNYPRFSAFIYSLEVFTPVLNLYQKEYWQPNAHSGDNLFHSKKISLRSGELLRSYFWAHIILGWVLTSLWVVGLTGLVKKR